ncbi:radical SAM protein [Nannocystaceae bacterium ST9]
MRTRRVETNRSCGLRCAHCPCSTRESAELVQAAPRAIALAREQGCEVLVLSGGEPLLRRDLDRLIAFARRGDRAPRVELASSAIGLDRARAATLRAAGLARARVSMPGWEQTYEVITRVPGSFASALAGLRALAEVGVEIELVVPLLRANLGELHELPERALAAGIPLAGVRLRVPIDDRDPPPLAAIAEAIERCDDAVRQIDPALLEGRASTRERAALALQLEPELMPPPCLFRRPARVGHLFALTRGGASAPGHRRLAACSACTLADRCPGFPERALAREPELAASPIVDDRTRRRLTQVASVDEQIARELVSRELGRDLQGAAWTVHTIRIHFLCNQACDFCFVSTHLPAPPEAAVRAAIVEAAREGAAIALSGGEPTLNPRLCDYLRFAREQGVRSIELQTNATRLADPALCQAVIDAGVDTVFVSLHGSRAEIGDAVTQAPGTWVASVAGLDQLAARRQRTRVNFVMCRTNAADFPALVELVARRWPDFDLTFSFVAPSTDLVPRTSALIPRYSEVIGPIQAGLERARALGLRVTGFESMCAIPLCLKPDGLGEYGQLSQVDAEIDRGEFDKPEPCTRCSQRERCWGVRSGYVALHGTGELRPFA